jgi:hypothetical protein
MVMQAVKISIFAKARDNPTASASMLVATAKVSRKNPLEKSFFRFSFSSSWNDYHIIFPPTNASKAKATQWSTSAIRPTTVSPRSQPIAGINAWKKPKAIDTLSTVGNDSLVLPVPLLTDTAKQSADKPRAIRIIEILSGVNTL